MIKRRVHGCERHRTHEGAVGIANVNLPEASPGVGVSHQFARDLSCVRLSFGQVLQIDAVRIQNSGLAVSQVKMEKRHGAPPAVIAPGSFSLKAHLTKSLRNKSRLVNRFSKGFARAPAAGDRAPTFTLVDTLRHTVPAVFQFPEFTAAGGLMSCGSSLAEALRVAGLYAGRILQGEKPAGLPV